jgi:serine/threonine protein kinase/lipopolysaccharide biosynthesis regulator YciM
MGEVYLAEDTRLHRKVAIKLLPPKSASDEQARKRLIREARTAAQLDHPNICAIHEVADDASFIVLQYIEGETLAATIRTKRLELRESLDIAIQILRALSEAHAQGIIHRDIKPQNIIITPRGQVKVLDFGLAKTVYQQRPIESEAETESILTETGTVVGTVGYMSPEQARGADLDARSDLFSVGALLYECVTGRPAFTGNNLIDICAQVIHVDPPAPSKINTAISAELDRVINKALAKEVDARYQSADEMLEDLRSSRDTTQPGLRVPTVPETLAPTSRINALSTVSKLLQQRSPSAAVAMLVSVIAVVALLVVPRFWRAAPHQPVPAAKQWYDRGTNYLRDGAYYQASKALQQAVNLDDKFALAHARLAEAWTELDYSDRAKDELLRVSALVPDRSALPKLEGVYLEAVTNTVTREFGNAIEVYRSLTEQVSQSEKAFAYVDLGRAYEKNEDTENAIRSYQEAAKLDPQYAPVYLRLAVLYGRQQDLNAASDKFDTAESLYQALSNQEGVSEVLFQRGALANKLGRLNDGRALLEKALDFAMRAGNKFQQIRSLLQLSHLTCVAGDITRAQQYATQASDLAQSDGIENLTTQGLIDLGYAFLVRNQTEKAEAYFKQALDLARINKGRRNEARALLMLGNLRMQQDNAGEARRFVEQALPFYQQGGYRKETAQALYLLGHSNDLEGDYKSALEAFMEQLRLAMQWNDESQIALSHEGIGTALSHQEEYPQALRSFEQCYAIYNSLGKQLNAGYALVNRADMLWRLNRYGEAQIALTQASDIAEKPESSYKQLLGRVYLVQARLSLSRLQLPVTTTTGQKALVAANTQSAHTAVEVKCVLGSALSLAGERKKSRRLCEDTVLSAKATGDPRLIADAELAFAGSLYETGEFEAALATALEAKATFSRAGQRESEWRACLIMARAAEHLSGAVKTTEYLSRAENVLMELQQRWGTEVFNAFCARPDVQVLRRPLTHALSPVR